MQKLARLSLIVCCSCFGSATTLEVLEGAKYMGTYGMKVIHDGPSASYVENDSPDAETRYRARFYLRLNSISIQDGEFFELFSGFDATNTKQFILTIKKSGGDFHLQSSVRNNAGSYEETMLQQSLVLSAGWHAIEMDWLADTTSGYLKIWFDGSASTGISGLENDLGAIDYVRLGAPAGVPAGASGSHDFDLFESRRISYIGLECHTPEQLNTSYYEWKTEYTMPDLVQRINARCP